MTLPPGVDPRDYRLEPHFWASQALPLGMTIEDAVRAGLMNFGRQRMAGDAAQGLASAMGVDVAIARGLLQGLPMPRSADAGGLRG
jgi:hypothetical protein